MRCFGWICCPESGFHHTPFAAPELLRGGFLLGQKFLWCVSPDMPDGMDLLFQGKFGII